MAKKISTKEFAEGLNNEGLDYAINYYYAVEDIADKKLAQLVKTAKDASDAVLNYLNETVPGWDRVDDLWESELESEDWNSDIEEIIEI